MRLGSLLVVATHSDLCESEVLICFSISDVSFQLLEEATVKLGLASAGRKIFLPDGTSVTDARQLYKDCAVYISMGDPFKDPYEAIKGKFFRISTQPFDFYAKMLFISNKLIF